MDVRVKQPEILNTEYITVFLNNIFDTNVVVVEPRKIKGRDILYFLTDTAVSSNNGIVFENNGVVIARLCKCNSVEILAEKYIDKDFFNAIKPFQEDDIMAEAHAFSVIKAEYMRLRTANKVFGEYFLAVRECYEVAVSSFNNKGISKAIYADVLPKSVSSVEFTSASMVTTCGTKVNETKFASWTTVCKALDCTLSFRSILN